MEEKHIFAIETKKNERGYFFVQADARLDNGDYMYNGDRFTAIENEETVVMYEKV